VKGRWGINNTSPARKIINASSPAGQSNRVHPSVRSKDAYRPCSAFRQGRYQRMLTRTNDVEAATTRKSLGWSNREVDMHGKIRSRTQRLKRPSCTLTAQRACAQPRESPVSVWGARRRSPRTPSPAVSIDVINASDISGDHEIHFQHRQN
jgi:hypothetical protein